MKAVKENENVKGKLRLNQCYAIAQCIFDLSSTTEKLKGKIVYALQKNEAKLESVLKKADKERKAIIDKYVKINKDGSYDLTKPSDEEIAKGARPEYIYKKDSDKELALKEISEMMEKEVDIEFHKIWMADFENIDINVSRNPNIALFIDYLVE